MKGTILMLCSDELYPSPASITVSPVFSKDCHFPASYPMGCILLKRWTMSHASVPSQALMTCVYLIPVCCLPTC